MDSDQGIFKLPAELRIKIYEHLLQFSHPIKLRTLVAGSPDTALLRVSKRWLHDALPVLYSMNRVVATRNDFCSNTDANLRTPIFGQHLKHLLIVNFGESIACNFSLRECAACENAAPGLLAALKAMPQLKTVLVDYTSQPSKFQAFSDALAMTHQDLDLHLKCTAVGAYKLTGPSISHLNFTFQYVPLARVWPTLIALANDPSHTEADEKRVLFQLREADPVMPDKAWLAIWLRKHGITGTLNDFSTSFWVDEEDLISLDEDQKDVRLHLFTQALTSHLKQWTAVGSREFLRYIRSAPDTVAP